MDMEIILFGSGAIGQEALAFLGNSNVVCFCDNNPELAGKEKHGKTVIPFQELKQEHKEAVVVISANRKIAYEIVNQCEENEIRDYVFYESLKDLYPERKDALAFLSDSENRTNMRKDIYFAKIKELQEQVDYLKRHADIRHMKPATGELRKWQLELADMSEEFFEKLHGLDIKPFLDGGNLLGYVRHNGFIPWDDDIDFALIRDEYEKLKDFCRKNICSMQEFANRKNTDVHNVTGMENYYWINFGDFIRIVKHVPGGNDLRVEFFSLDFYNDAYTFEELMKFSEEKRKKMIKGSFEEMASFFEAVLNENRQNIVKDSSHIYFGIDNMEIRNTHSKNQWIPKEVIFPLQRIQFEGKSFWVPNKPEEFLQYEYDSIWDYPDDVGAPKHYGGLGISE